MTNIYIIGCGGIGSYLAEFIYKAREAQQISVLTDITLVDFDSVELKNINYQNFTMEDAGMNKARVLSNRYNFKCLEKKIETGDECFTKENDIIICCVDNSKTRHILYNHCRNYAKFLDLRSKGSVVAIYNGETSVEEYEKSLGDYTKDDNTSCQNDFELAKNKIQYGNLICASIGTQYLINIIRGEKTENLVQVF